MRHFTKNSRTFHFAWNSVGDNAWIKLETIFIAAFMDAYKDFAVDNLPDSEEINAHWDQTYKQFYPSRNSNEFIKEVLAPIEKYLSFNDKTLSAERELIKAHFNNRSETAAQENINEAKKKILYLRNLKNYLKIYFDDEHRMIKTQKQIQYLVTYYEDQPVAFFSAERNWKSGRAYIRLATVLPQFYKHGIASAAFEEICRHLGTQGRYELITLKKGPALPFYRKAGLREMPEFDAIEPANQSEIKKTLLMYFDQRNILRLPPDEAESSPNKFVAFCT